MSASVQAPTTADELGASVAHLSSVACAHSLLKFTGGAEQHTTINPLKVLLFGNRGIYSGTPEQNEIAVDHSRKDRTKPSQRSRF